MPTKSKWAKYRLRSGVASVLLLVTALIPRVAQAVTITEIIDSTGDAAGNILDTPGGIAVDDIGNVYVTGGLSNNVFKITPDGVITEIMDATGDGTNILDTPEDIAVDSSRNVYVEAAFFGSCPPCDGKAFKITPSGVITQIIDSSGDGTGNMLELPRGITVDGSGNVYVGGRLSDNVFKITAGGAISEIIDNTGDGTNSFNDPEGIAVDGSGNVYVSALQSRNVFKVTPAGVITQIIDATGDGTNSLSGPGGVAVDGSGNVYVTGINTDNAFKITPGGVITQIIDAAGDGLGNMLNRPDAIAVDEVGNVYVSSNVIGDSAVFRITPGGVITRIIDSTGDGAGNTFDVPVRFSVTARAGFVYVAGAASRNAFKIQLCGDGDPNDPGEECDDGDLNNGDCCSSTCTAEDLGTQTCGTGVCEQVEDVCLNGEPKTCTPRSPTETQVATCDDVEDNDCDGAVDCNDTDCFSSADCNEEICQFEPTGSSCDDGNPCTIDDQCQTVTCQGNPNTCGDGTFQPGCEECEGDGDCGLGDVCNASCLCEAVTRDHYQCYKAKELKRVCQDDLATKCKASADCPVLCLEKFVSRNVSLTDQFGSSSSEVKKPKSLCAPVRKNPQGPPPQDLALHYKRYQIKGGPPVKKLRVLARDQFGDHVIELIKEDSLLVPAAKDPNDPVEPLAPGVNHYLCYKAKNKKKLCTDDLTTKCKTDADCTGGGICDLGFGKVPQQLTDQFGTSAPEIKKVKFFCTPVDKDGEGIADPSNHLIGYQLKGSGINATIHTNDQFGPEALALSKQEILFVPAEKNPAP